MMKPILISCGSCPLRIDDYYIRRREDAGNGRTYAKALQEQSLRSEILPRGDQRLRDVRDAISSVGYTYFGYIR
jgi:hypothetical protein